MALCRPCAGPPLPPLVHRARVLFTLNQYTALAPCLEGVGALGQLLSGSPGRDDVAHTLAVHLGNLGDLHRERGDLMRAGLAYAQSLQICRDLQALDHHNVFWRHTFAVSLMRWVRHQEQEQRSSLALAAEAGQEAHTVLTGLLEYAPARRDWAELLAECASELALLSTQISLQQE